MTVSALPDRERRHLLQFHFVPRLTYGPRFLLAAGLIGAGLLVQLLLTGTSVVAVLFLSVPLLLAGTFLLLVRGYDLQPARLGGGADWEKTTRERFHEALELDRQVRRWDETSVDITCKLGFVLLVVLGIVIFFLYMKLDFGDHTSRHFAPLFVVDAILLLFPHWITGTRRGWRPTSLREIIGSLETALAAIESFEAPACQIQPMLRVTGKDGQQTPEDARVFIRFPDGDENFLGLQFQVSLNEVGGTNYPYLYAVLVARKEFGLAAHIATVERTAADFTVEFSRETDVDVVVIRRTTSKSSGYHTPAKWVSRLARAAWASTAGILGPKR